MKSEVLTCTQCSSTWNRQKARGRKPKICPSCVTTLEQIEDDEDDNGIDLTNLQEEPPPAKTKYKPGSKWKCTSCGVSIKIGIGIDIPPTHRCQKKLKRVLPLELQ